MGSNYTTQCCIAGGGPAGLMLGYLLARAGIQVIVLEKHPDFLRDFRGDTVHPSTMEVMGELGLLDRFLELPHNKVERLVVQFGEFRTEMADLTQLPVRAPYIAMMPQWDFLSFLAEEAQRYPNFTLGVQCEVTGLIEKDGKVAGVTATTPDGPIEVHADLVVGADGRGSVLRKESGLHIETVGAPMDVLWFRISRTESDPADTMGRFDPGRILVMINRNTYWQLAYVIPKGSLEKVRAAGLDAFRESVAKAAPYLADRMSEVGSWDDVKLLTVRVDRLTNWYKPGLLFIGDAAHAMSPIGGVGINLAIQDAVAAANILAPEFAKGAVTTEELRSVQVRRAFPTRVTQKLQVLMQNNIIAPALAGPGGNPKPPLFIRAMAWFPFLRLIPARAFGLGVQPEHVSLFIRDEGGRNPT
jgi:2-polyprenyl-6-methoxyphenol hydroxylase-like FAD-dependent oxidoreductase